MKLEIFFTTICNKPLIISAALVSQHLTQLTADAMAGSRRSLQEYAMQAINGLHEWKKSGIQPVLPPIERNMPEGTKKNKRMAKDEPQKLKPRQLSRRGLVMNCRYCGEPGHNIKSKMDRSSWTLLCAVSYEHIAS
ncbi:hypothetical protein Golob_027467 [Gossypium lobatum]|uniref:Uncharacterized protein n=1 Tax=Gossypium lobatum TaxID=34289 RepID=A0A7J8NKA4_9ROSI|nr:hypothetical protein [Gossypium lobatum]